MPTKFIKSHNNKIASITSTSNSSTHILFCGGFKSSMQGSKAIALEEFCNRNNLSCTRFDYSGHGISDGDFADGNIDIWLDDTLSVIDSLQHPQHLIIIGSSMGAWLATLAAKKRSDRLAALVTIAAAPDFTERLLLPALNKNQQELLRHNKPVLMPSEYDDASPYPITAQLIANSKQHCLLGEAIEIDVPVRMLHGTSDTDVPFELSIELMKAIRSSDMQLNLIKNADHRLSSPEHLLILEQTITRLMEQLNS